ncbi:leucine-rich repeat-containing protein 23 isoform X3 [Hylobates moloch]|uniref:leucine-rich repeat-containing protein 23 isoform X3 n=1 Tax=Hylobates moloch TaxID=81572 RepID=UPI002676911D|nr:leucine-rich repeat-containing protein 23 isoform X3 [Hylobates moloch]
MSDEDDLEDFEPDQGDSEKEEDEKETEEGEDYRKEGEEFPEEWLPTPLTEDMMKEGLSLLCKTGNGLAHAYVKLEVKERDLTDIYLLRSYIHLRYVDISENHLTDLSPLNYLTHLLWLKADGNRLRSAQLNELPYLQIASFAYNQITDTEGISHPRLETLNLKGNSIHMVTGLDPQKLISLHTVELRGNQLESTLGINLPKLKNLYLVAAKWTITEVQTSVCGNVLGKLSSQTGFFFSSYTTTTTIINIRLPGPKVWDFLPIHHVVDTSWVISNLIPTLSTWG